MKLQEYRFLSGDGEDELYGCAWLPDGPVKGYIQILHDLYDHIERYMHLLQFFAEHGYAAFGHVWLVMEGLYIETVPVKSVQDIPIDTLSRMRKQCFIWLLRMPCQRRNRRSPIFMH